jgi:hypothetical protein
MLKSASVPLSESALLVIDPQDSFKLRPERWIRRSNPHFEHNVGARRVAITGIAMEQCCETTARVASDLGYAVDFVIDATMTFPIPNPD